MTCHPEEQRDEGSRVQASWLAIDDGRQIPRYARVETHLYDIHS